MKYFIALVLGLAGGYSNQSFAQQTNDRAKQIYGWHLMHLLKTNKSSVQMMDFFIQKNPDITTYPSLQEFAKFLIDEGADVNVQYHQSHTSLMLASRHGRLKIVEMLIEAGAIVDARGGLSDWTALLYASGNGHLEIVKLLIEAGADMNAQSDLGATALYLADRYDHEGVAQYLRSLGAECNTDIIFMLPVCWN